MQFKLWLLVVLGEAVQYSTLRAHVKPPPHPTLRHPRIGTAYAYDSTGDIHSDLTRGPIHLGERKSSAVSLRITGQTAYFPLSGPTCRDGLSTPAWPATASALAVPHHTLGRGGNRISTRLGPRTGIQGITRALAYKFQTAGKKELAVGEPVALPDNKKTGACERQGNVRST